MLNKDFVSWKKIIQGWVKNNNGLFKISKNSPLGDFREYYTVKTEFSLNNFDITVDQNCIIGCKFFPSYLIFTTSNKQLFNFNMSLYQKGFLEKLFNSDNAKTGIKIFDKKFGVYTTDKLVATRLFGDKRVQNLFLNNKFLVFNAQKNKSTVTLKSMETKLYEISELQQLLDDFIYILKIIKNEKI
jgi:hypothetical protein